MGIKDLDLSKIPENGGIRAEIMRVQKKGRMNVTHVIGLPGTGKSWYCLRLAEQLAEDFHGDSYKITKRNIVHNLLELLTFIRSVRKAGEVVICEEMSVWLNSKRAMSSENVDASYVWDTLRKKRVIVIGNNPIKKEIDKSLVSLSTMQVQTLSLNKSLGVCIVKPLALQTNPDTGKTYRHRIHMNGFEVHRCWSGKPSKELTDEYEKMKDDFLDELYQRLHKKHKEKQEKEVGKVLNKVMAVTNVETKRASLRERGLTPPEIAQVEGVSPEAIRKTLHRYDAKISKILEKENKNVPKTAELAT